MAKTTALDIGNALRASGLVRVGGGSKYTYYGLPGSAVGPGRFIRMGGKTVNRVKRWRPYGMTKGLEDTNVESAFYGKIPDAKAWVENAVAWLKAGEEPSRQKRVIEEQVRELQRTLKAQNTLDVELLKDLAVGAESLAPTVARDLFELADLAATCDLRPGGRDRRIVDEILTKLPRSIELGQHGAPIWPFGEKPQGRRP